MTPAQALEVVMTDYVGILKNIAARRKVLDRLERQAHRNYRKVTRLLKQVNEVLQTDTDAADYWKTGNGENCDA